MMTLFFTLLVSFLVLLGVIGAMSIGVIAGRKPISGSCGGLNNGSCELCGGGDCQQESKQ